MAKFMKPRAPRRRFLFLHWFTREVPQTFRRHIRAFWLSLGLTLLGAAFGAGILYFDPDAKESLLPFSHLLGKPSERVAEEEQNMGRRLEGRKASFAGFLMTHNIQVSLLTLAMGMTYGVGTVVVLFYNGVILGAVSLDYIQDGQTRFLLGWLLPHGSIEIPSVMIAGQAGFVLAGALIGSRKRLTSSSGWAPSATISSRSSAASACCWSGPASSRPSSRNTTSRSCPTESKSASASCNSSSSFPTSAFRGRKNQRLKSPQ